MDQEKSVIGESEQEKIDDRLNENLALPTKDEGLVRLIKEAKRLDMDPQYIKILEDEEK